MCLRNVIDLTVVVLLCVQQTERTTTRDEATEHGISTRHGLAGCVVREKVDCTDNISMQTDTNNANISQGEEGVVSVSVS